jgi:hypothetical protein
VDAATVRILVEALEAEINNGGFDQFFFNSAGDKTLETIEALTAIGAAHTAAIVRSAADKFPRGRPPQDRDARQALLEEISPDGDAFSDEDEAFLEYREDLAALVTRYAT